MIELTKDQKETMERDYFEAIEKDLQEEKAREAYLEMMENQKQEDLQ